MYLLPSTSTSVAPVARAMKIGDPPTDLNARTGLSTPPGRSCVARAKSFFDLSVCIAEANVNIAVMKAIAIVLSLWTAFAVAQRESQAAGPSFEVASIKRSVPVERQPRGFLPTPGRFTAADVPAAALIGFAYRDAMDEMRGTPEWSKKENYDVMAPYPPGTAPSQVALMLRTLLVERFHLATHFESEQRDVLSLVLAQPGAPLKGLRAIDVDCDALAAAARALPPPPPSPTAEMPP